jgi:hypothetical protein
MQLRKANIRTTIAIFSVVYSLTACATDHKSTMPLNDDSGGTSHEITDPNKLANYRITINNAGDIVLLDDKGEPIRPNADLPLKVHAEYIEAVETVTIVRYRGSPEFDIVKIGNRSWMIPVEHTH